MSDTDSELLARYTRHRAEDAFAELVRRHVALVHSAALRQVRSPQLAEEVAQSTFLKLAQHARQLAPDTILSAWLYQVTRREAIDVVRRETRRQLREQIATEMNAMNATAADWTHIEPLLDEAMHALDETDRAAVLLRYFENKSLREVGQALGASENAAQKRLTRAVEQLRGFFTKRGVAVGASGMVAIVSANAVQAAPVGLVATISTTAALAGLAVQTSTAVAAKTIAMTTFQKTLIGTTLVAAVSTAIYQTYQASQLRTQFQDLQQQLAPLGEQIARLQSERDDANSRLARRTVVMRPRLPAPPVAAPPSPVASSPTETLVRMLKGGEAPKLTVQQLESYLKENARGAESLLAAYRSTRDPELLREAMRNFPNHPQVAFEAAFTKDSSPEDRRRWFDSLKASAPDNALADYLSAADHIKAGRVDLAVQDLISASGKSQFLDFTQERMLNDEEAYRAAGYSMAEAKTLPTAQLLLPHITEMRDMGRGLTELAASYRQAGDEASAQAVLEMAAGLGSRYSTGFPGVPEISQMVGIIIERDALGQMRNDSLYGAGQTVKERLNLLAQQEAELRHLFQKTEETWPRMSAEDWVSYKDRWQSFGEVAAGRWLINKYGK